MNDRELLELAAKATGLGCTWNDAGAMHWEGLWSMGVWNPLADDGDALRLAVKLGVIIDVRYGDKPGAFTVEVCYWPRDYTGPYMSVREKSEDQLSAARRAIVRAAAAIGAAMNNEGN